MHPSCAARERDGNTPLSELNDTALQLLEAPQRARRTMNPVRISAAASPCSPAIGRLATVIQHNRRYDGGVAASVDVGHMSHIGTRRTRQQWVASYRFAYIRTRPNRLFVAMTATRQLTAKVLAMSNTESWM